MELLDLPSIVVALVVVLCGGYLHWRWSRTPRARVEHPIRRADNPELMSAGSATVLNEDLVSSVIIRFCAAREQMQLKATSRAWRDAVRTEIDDWMDSHHELSILAFFAEMDLDTMLKAKTLRLPPPAVIGQLSSEEGKGLGVLLRYSRSLTHLNLNCNNLTDAGAVYVAAALRDNTTLTSLILDSNEIGDEGGVALARGLMENRTLTHLSVRENGVGPEVHFRHEGESTGIGDATAKALAQLLAVNDTLRVLVLGSCEIGDDGARALASALRRGSSDGRVTPPSAPSAENTALIELDMRENQLSDVAKEEVRVAAASRGPASSCVCEN